MYVLFRSCIASAVDSAGVLKKMTVDAQQIAAILRPLLGIMREQRVPNPYSETPGPSEYEKAGIPLETNKGRLIECPEKLISRRVSFSEEMIFRVGIILRTVSRLLDEEVYVRPVRNSDL